MGFRVQMKIFILTMGVFQELGNLLFKLSSLSGFGVQVYDQNNLMFCT